MCNNKRIIINIINYYFTYVMWCLWYWQLFEFAELGSVKTYLQCPPSDLSDHCAITVSMLLEYAIQIAHGLVYLESQSFVHGDLAACNVMRSSSQQASCCYTVYCCCCFFFLCLPIRFQTGSRNAAFYRAAYMQGGLRGGKRVRPSVCPSHAWIVTKRKHLAKKVQLWLIASRLQAFQWA